MLRFPKNFLRCLALLGLVAGVQAAPFVAPAEEKPPFRRDLLPIDTDSMANLSHDLTILSRGLTLETAAVRRAAAQSLALALALDPANSVARDCISELLDGNDLKPAKSGRLTLAKSRIWQIHAWLGTPEADKDGNLLGEMLGNAASVLDPDNPAAAELRSSPESDRWDGWVAPLAEFEEKAVAKNDVDPFEDIKPDMPVPDEPKNAEVPILLKAASLNTVLYVYDKLGKSWNLSPSGIEMNVTTEEVDSFRISVTGDHNEQQRIEKSVSGPILKALEEKHSGLPGKGLVSIGISGGEPYSEQRNGTNISGPAFILANSALTGVEPQATVIAVLNDKGQLVAPDFFWNRLNALGKGTGGRLVVPAGTEEYVTAMLTLEEPMFFLKYEVLVASSPEQFIEFCAKTPSVENAAAFASFQEIKAKAEKNAIGTYLSNRFVRERLEGIVEALPYHLSARLLALQGSGKRPRTLTKKVLASEIWRVIAPIRRLTNLDMRMAVDSSSEELEDLYDTMRTDLDRLDRYVDIRDRDLLTEGKDAAIAVRTLDRAIRMRSDDMGERFTKIQSAHKNMVVTRDELLEKLSKLSGDPYAGDR